MLLYLSELLFALRLKFMDTKNGNLLSELNNDNTDSLETEVLFKNRGEELAYSEPKKVKIEVLEEGIFEEGYNLIPAKKDDSKELKTEVLFKSGVEEIEVKEEVALSEESLVFQEPQKPNYVVEEVLFKINESEEPINYSLFDNEVLPEEAKNELLATEKQEEESDYQLSFGDLDSIALNALESKNVIENTEKKKVIKKCFAEKLLEADSVIQENYHELKNILLSYKKVKSRISNTADTFNMGRTKLAKLSVTGKSLKLYLNLDFNEVEPRLKCRDSSQTKAYEEVPVFLRIRSLRAMKNARYLIGKLAERFELQENPKAVKVDALALIKEELE